MDISIHAPRVGRDSSFRRCPCTAAAFQSTRPVWGATGVFCVDCCQMLISIHAPRVGRDAFWKLRPVLPEYFNPRAPCGARLFHNVLLLVSKSFQSTRPVWGATDPHLVSLEIVIFQSTRPVWGATSAGGKLHKDCKISIHAPRVGRDQGLGLLSLLDINFNPRAPCGARQVVDGALQSGFDISIHAPRVGRDRLRGWVLYIPVISIHAPRVGRDRAPKGTTLLPTYFNPRAPCGARRQI